MNKSARDRWIGVWRLVSVAERTAGGRLESVPQFGSDPDGRLIYTESGHVSVQFMRRDRPLWRAEDAPTREERADAAAGYGAYAGRYEVDEEKGTVTHRIDVALIPNRVGRDLERHFSFEGEDLLTLRPPPVRRADGTEVHRELVWRRVS